MYGKDIGFLVGFLGFGIFLGWIFWDFGGIWGVILGVFLEAFF